MAYEYTIPVYIKAKTADDLMFEMAKTNRKHGANLRYFDVQYAKGQWYAWYYLESSKYLREKVNAMFGDEAKRLTDG